MHVFIFCCKQCHGNYTLTSQASALKWQMLALGELQLVHWHFAAPFVEWPKSQVRKL